MKPLNESPVRVRAARGPQLMHSNILRTYVHKASQTIQALQEEPAALPCASV